MPIRTKKASVSEDGTPINQRAPYVAEPSSLDEEVEEEAETGSETGFKAGAEEDTMNQNPNTKGLNEETEPMKPTQMFFPTTEYNKAIKIETRCSLYKTLKTLERVLTEKELKWFRDHPQFKETEAEGEKEPEAEGEKEPEAEGEKEPDEKELEAEEEKKKRIKKPAAALRNPYQAQNAAKRRKKN